MIDPAEPQDASPYASPPIVQDLRFQTDGDPPGLPWIATMLYAFCVTLASAAVVILLGLIGEATWGLIWLLMPLLAIFGFVGLCLTLFGRRRDVRSRSLAWKISMLFAVPPAAMLVFVPTCTGSGMVILPFVSGAASSSEQWWIVIACVPIFLALWLTCHFVAIRLGRRFVVDSSTAASGPYHEIAPDPSFPLSAPSHASSGGPPSV